MATNNTTPVNKFIDYFEAEFNHLTKQAELDVPQQYEKMLLMGIVFDGPHYDDIDDYININKALTRLIELNNEHIQQCVSDFHNKQNPK